MHGITDRTTVDGIRILRVHYSADPNKNPATVKGKDWLETEGLDGYPGGMKSSKWQREMEIDFDVVEGKKVFENLELFEDRLLIDPFDISGSWQLYGSLDFASRGVSSFHVHAKAKGEDDYYTIWEYYKQASSYIETAEAVKKCPYFSLLKWIVADISIWAKNYQRKVGTSGKVEFLSYATLFQEEGLELEKGSPGGDTLIADFIKHNLWKLETELKENIEFQPRYRIFKSCPKLWWELKRLRYKDWTVATGQERNEKEEIVDKDNHAFDELKYFFKKLTGGWSDIPGFNPKKNSESLG